MILKTWLPLIALLISFPAHSEEITEVKVEGVPLEWVESVKALTGFLPGDEVEQTKIASAQKRLKEYFENKGYPLATMSVDEKESLEAKPKDHNLNFRVKLGEPIRIYEIEYRFLNGALTKEQQLRLNVAVDFQPGEPFDRDRVKEIRRAIEGTLTSLSFVDSRISKVDTSAVKKGVKLFLEVELGQRVVFSVQGNEFFARSELTTLIEEQRGVGLGRDYVSVLQGRIRDRYVENGFRNVAITPYSFEAIGEEPRKILFMIQENQRFHIKQVIFDGNDVFTSAELEALYFKSASDRIQSRIYNETMAEDAARGMIEEIKRKGYLSAKLIAFKTQEMDSKGNLLLRIFVNEGLQTRVQRIEFKGQTIFTAEKLSEFLGIHEGNPLNLVQLEDGIDRIKREYRNEGYLKIQIDNEAKNQIVAYSEKNQNAYLTFDLTEGAQFRLSEARVFGNEKTVRQVILQEVQIQPGEVLAENKIALTEERLRRLGIFSQVTIELMDEPGDPLKKALKITVQEGIPGNLGYGVGYRNDLGIRLFGDVSYSNLWGQNHTWVFNASGNRRLDKYQFLEYSGQMSYIWPWIFMGETTFRPSFTAEKRQYIQFNAETFGISASFERAIWNKIGLSGMLTYSVERIRQFGATNIVDNQQIRIGSITPLLRIDLRDNPVIPHRGFYALTSYEYAHPYLASQGDPVPVNYGRFQVRTDWYIDYIPKVVWYTSVRGGWIRNFADTSPNGVNDPRVAVPLIKQFALGGVNSLRGFIQQEINVQDKNIQGYSTFTNYRTQFDYFVTQALSIGPFLDAGNLNIDSFTFGALRFGSGVGLRYTTPIGPVNFDWGFKLFPKPGEQANVFYFSLGVI